MDENQLRNLEHQLNASYANLESDRIELISLQRELPLLQKRLHFITQRIAALPEVMVKRNASIVNQKNHLKEKRKEFRRQDMAKELQQLKRQLAKMEAGKA
jgi:chromosome segregation ATPase